MDDEQLDALISTLEDMLDLDTEVAHRHSVPYEFERSRTFTKEELKAVWAQGRKDAYRFVLVNLRHLRGY